MSARDAAVDLSALLLPMTAQLLIVPSVVVAEIIKRRELERPADAPDWLLGHLKWREQVVPVLSFETLNGDAISEQDSGSRIVIFSALAEQLPVPHYALLTRGVPNLLRLTAEVVQPFDSAMLGPAERMKVQVYGLQGAIPDFDYIERHVARL